MARSVLLACVLALACSSTSITSPGEGDTGGTGSMSVAGATGGKGGIVSTFGTATGGASNTGGTAATGGTIFQLPSVLYKGLPAECPCSSGPECMFGVCPIATTAKPIRTCDNAQSTPPQLAPGYRCCSAACTEAAASVCYTGSCSGCQNPGAQQGADGSYYCR